MIFNIRNYENIPVILSSETWYKKLFDPTFGHPEVKPFLSQIKNTISYPDYVYQSLRDKKSKLLFTKIFKGIFISYFLCVVVKYIKEQNIIKGYVSTVMINRKLPKTSKLIWTKKVLI